MGANKHFQPFITDTGMYYSRNLWIMTLDHYQMLVNLAYMFVKKNILKPQHAYTLPFPLQTGINIEHIHKIAYVFL